METRTSTARCATVAGEQVVLAMERLEGMPLGQHMRGGPVPRSRDRVLRQLCRTLDMANALGVRHGALSVASVILVEHEGAPMRYGWSTSGSRTSYRGGDGGPRGRDAAAVAQKLGRHVFDSRERRIPARGGGLCALAERPLFHG